MIYVQDAGRIMRNENAWAVSKYAPDGKGRWRANGAEVPVTSRLITNRVAEVYAQMIGLHARGQLADISCGNAPLYEMYRPLVDDIVCIDWEATRHTSVYVDKFVDLNSTFDIGEKSFDTIIATDVIEHLCEPHQFFSACASALRPKGKLLIGVPFLYWIHEAPHDYHRYTRHGLEYMLHKAGLKCVSLEPYGGGPEVLSDILTKGLGGFRPAATAAHHLLSWVLACPPVKRMSSKSSEAMPLGYVVVAEKPIQDDQSTSPSMTGLLKGAA